MVDKINLAQKFEMFNEFWTPKILGEVNNSYVKIFKAKGEFVWYSHDREDEFFLVLKGQLVIKMRGSEVIFNVGVCFVVPKGKEHMPSAMEETHVLIFEPKEVVNTGDNAGEKTVKNPKWI